jgi:hypothetical protein
METKPRVKAVGDFDNLISYQRLTRFIHSVEMTEGKCLESPNLQPDVWRKKHT